MRKRRQTAHERRMEAVSESIYQTLRSYQRGSFAATSGVVAGALDIPLTTAYDQIAAAVDKAFRPIRSRT